MRAVIEMFDADEDETMDLEEFRPFYEAVADGSIQWPYLTPPQTCWSNDRFPKPIFDRGGWPYNCEYYDDPDNAWACGYYDDYDFKANEVCCGCGGGCDCDPALATCGCNSYLRAPTPVSEEPSEEACDCSDTQSDTQESEHMPSPEPDEIWAICDVDQNTTGYLDANEIPTCYSTICGMACTNEGECDCMSHD